MLRVGGVAMSPALFLGLVVAATVGAALFGMGLGLACAIGVRWYRQWRTADVSRLDLLRAVLED